jgi:Xaa-Pro aminopeptidase
MHYVRNEDPIRTGDLVLVDAGAEFRGYAADVTRTFPADGRFQGVQAELYDLVLAAQEAALAAVRPGAHFNAPHEAAARVLTAGLVDLKLLAGDLDGLLEREAARPWCVHKSSHWLGLDVHDVGDYRIGEAWRQLEPGMVLTVEPGLYFPPELEGTPAALRGIGIRIEDDVVVTREGNEVLTAGAPKTRAAIEAVMAEDGP